MTVDYDAELLDALDLDSGALIVPERWSGMPGVAFGGFAVSAMFVAAAAQSRHPRPLSMHARFHRPVPVDRAIALTVKPEYQGRTVESFRTSLVVGDRVLVTGSAAFGSPTPIELRSQTAKPMAPLKDPVPLWTLLEQLGHRIPGVMKTVGHRTAGPVPPSESERAWHIHSDWPATTSESLNTRAAVAIMCVDAFIAPATMVANGVDPSEPWPAMAPNVDIATWFHDVDADPPSESAPEPGWLNLRTTVPGTRGGYAVGRTEVWAGDRLYAEGMSQVLLVPIAGR